MKIAVCNECERHGGCGFEDAELVCKKIAAEHFRREQSLKKGANCIGGITIKEIRSAIDGHDDKEFVYLDGFDFGIHETSTGNIEFTASVKQ